MRPREFIVGISAAAWPMAAPAQPTERVRRIGVLMWLDDNDPGAESDRSAFTHALAGLWWPDGRNVRMDLRWFRNAINPLRARAQELVGLRPDVILSSGEPAALQQWTQTIPIVFAGVGDPVASGIVTRLNRPSGNITGF